ncbi:phospho-N-acetylmuramoyl-pentapeptide-transferase [Candidatus Wolfebacteria bacterium]|nr:phospho-N-acetylmuramoyl-pentapeptide-transferase [Candidatus Wolfebacteria bacterium]
MFILSFAAAFLLAPVLIHYLYKFKAWKKKPRDRTFGGQSTPIFTSLHGVKEVQTPRMGGILIWGTVLIVTLGIYFVSLIFPDSIISKMNFFSRSQTWLPFFILIASSILGLVDDLLVINNKGEYVGGGIRFKTRLFLISLIALIGAWWFYFKLGWTSIYIPFYGNIEIDGLYILLFIIVLLATFSSGVVDGLDGLSAGVLAPIFAAFGVISYSRELYDLAAFIIVIIGALIAYLWFNIHPAKFYMGETGIMGLTVVLAVIALLTNSVLFLPIIAFILVLESSSVILQLFSKKIFKKKLFLVAPIHHHFEALGWPETKVTMRFWIISAVASGLGLILFFLSKFII